MCAVVFSLIIGFKVSAQKISIPASILLVLAVLQDRWHSTLPPGLKYFAYMDELFMFAYLVTVRCGLAALCLLRESLLRCLGEDRR